MASAARVVSVLPTSIDSMKDVMPRFNAGETIICLQLGLIGVPRLLDHTTTSLPDNISRDKCIVCHADISAPRKKYCDLYCKSEARKIVRNNVKQLGALSP